MKTNVYRVVLQVIDHENNSVASVLNALENNRYLSVSACEHDVREVDWSDEHPLNHSNTSAAAFEALFAPLAAADREPERATESTEASAQTRAAMQEPKP